MSRICPRCKERDVIEGQPYCRECSRAWSKEYYHKNKDKCRAAMKRWRQSLTGHNREHYLQKRSEYYHKIMSDPEKHEAYLAYRRKWWHDNPDKVKEMGRRKRAKQKERNKALKTGADAIRDLLKRLSA